ncbi:MAG: valine--tRNA ligase [Holosporales bacterium]|nr:valine--tRNA ligase [Holosporales bacterium]
MAQATSMLEKTYDPKQFESEIYQKNISNFYPNNENNKCFSILMPPPNVTGSLHLGHALTYTIQDILIRYYRQNRFNTLWQPGIDHAGIATQMVVEKDLIANGINPKELSREEFIEKTWEWKNQSGDKIFEQQKALGCSAPWELSRFTMDENFSKSVIEAFVVLYKNGLIYKAKRLVNWDNKFQTAISDLEIQNKEENGILWHIKYQLENSNEFITIATTRPETMFGDTAIAVHPDDERYKYLVGKVARIPYTDRLIPIIADGYIDMEKGTGCLKVTPAHDINDFAIGKRHNLEMISILDKYGNMVPGYTPKFLEGLYLKKARKLLLEKLKEDQLLVKEEEITHTLPYGDRSGTVIEPMLTDQWFVDAKRLADAAIKAVEEGKVRFYPEKWKNTYFEWMKNIEPWCISRQIIWGHQIPAWYGPNGEIFVEKSEQEAIEAAKKADIAGDQLTRETDVLDTWFSSGLWPFATLGWPEQTKMSQMFYPTTTLVTGFDIIFFWVARMMMMSMYFMNEIPFKDIYVHALVRDEKGQKMSKSKGNVMDPLSLMEEFGADALRFTLAFLSVPGRDIKFGKEHVKISRNFITKIWNAARFLQSKGVPFENNISSIILTSDLNKWIITKLKKFQIEIDQNIKEYRFDYATRNIQFFIRDIFCDFFVEAIKIIDNAETKAIAGAVFAEFLRIANPFIPFITDYLANVLGIAETLIFSSSDNVLKLELYENAESEVDKLISIIHSLRSEKQITEELKNQIDDLSGELKKIAESII